MKCNKEIRYIDLVSEIGELGKEILKSSDYGKEDNITTQNIKVEIWDCIFSLFALCDELEIDGVRALDDAMLNTKNVLMKMELLVLVNVFNTLKKAVKFTAFFYLKFW